jgi:hypothetical protein
MKNLLRLDDLFTAFPRHNSKTITILFEDGTTETGLTNIKEETFHKWFPVGIEIQRCYYNPSPSTQISKIAKITYQD